ASHLAVISALLFWQSILKSGHHQIPKYRKSNSPYWVTDLFQRMQLAVQLLRTNLLCRRKKNKNCTMLYNQMFSSDLLRRQYSSCTPTVIQLYLSSTHIA